MRLVRLRLYETGNQWRSLGVLSSKFRSIEAVMDSLNLMYAQVCL
jgi:hypothetical protein